MEKQIIHLFVFNTLADWETGYAVAGVNNPDMQKQPGRYQIQTVGLAAEPSPRSADSRFFLIPI